MKKQCAKFLSCTMALVLGTTMLSPIAMANATIPEPHALNMISDRAIKGTFTDFFSDATFAQIVADALGKNASDQVTLFELQKVTELSIKRSKSGSSTLSIDGIGYLMALQSFTISGDTIVKQLLKRREI